MSDDDLERLANLLAVKLAALLGRAPAAPLRRGEAARALGVDVHTLDAWVRQGMPSIDCGTFRQYDLDACRAWLAARPTKRAPAAPTAIATAEPDARPMPLRAPPGVQLRSRPRRTGT